MTLTDDEREQLLRGHFELPQEIDTSSTANGTFLKFDAIYRPGPEGAPADPDGWEDLEKSSRWYVELVPVDDFLVINFIEQKASGRL